MNLKVSKKARWFFLQLRPLLRAHLFSVGLIVLSSLMFLLDPLLIKWLIDRVLPERDFRLLLLSAAGFLGVYVFRLGFSALAGLVSFKTVQELVFRIRLSILEQMNRLSADYHETTPIGEKLYRIEQDVDQVSEVGSSLVPYVLQTAFNALFVVGIMVVLDFRLTCMILPLVPFFLVFSRYFDGRLRRASDLAQQESTNESSFLQEHLDSVIQIQLLHQEKKQTQAFLDRAIRRVEALNSRMSVEILFGTSYMALIAFGSIAILGYGGYQVFRGVLTVGGLVAFYSYMARLFDPLHAAVDIYARLKRLDTSISRILEVVEKAPSVRESATPVQFPSSMRGHIELKRACFSYRPGQRVLNSLDLELEPGEKVALVGVSGSGKSTITKLIARLYDVEDGTIRIDGIDIRNLRLESLRTGVCYLMQDTVLFDRTLRENLALGKPTATSEELTRALEIADLGDLVLRLPKRLDTRLGPRGRMLSGGERQRVALARAVLQNPRLLLLDEATAALDAPSERRVFGNLAEHFPHQTMVIISHRICALKWVDRIVVLNRGMIVEQGTHDQLLRTGSIYTYLHNSVPDIPSSDALRGTAENEN